MKATQTDLFAERWVVALAETAEPEVPAGPRQPRAAFLGLWLETAQKHGIEMGQVAGKRGVPNAPGAIVARGELCRRARAELGLSYHETARELRVSPATVRNALLGYPNSLHRLAKTTARELAERVA